MNEQEIIKTQQELIDLLYSQVVDLSMMSKIELGDDVIAEIKRLKSLLNEERVKKREQAELERKRLEAEQEKARIDEIKCPVCKSTDTIHHIKRQNNGIYGPGSSSWVTEEYLICKSCCVHYSDISKPKQR
jgi:uncharacterized protein YbaR (Trm112 family)